MKNQWTKTNTKYFDQIVIKNFDGITTIERQRVEHECQDVIHPPQSKIEWHHEDIKCLEMASNIDPDEVLAAIWLQELEGIDESFDSIVPIGKKVKEVCQESLVNLFKAIRRGYDQDIVININHSVDFSPFS